MPTTFDGCEVDSCSEEWRAECEARHVLRLNGYWVPDGRGGQVKVSAKRHRHEYLDRVEAKRGVASREQLQDHVRRLWDAGR